MNTAKRQVMNGAEEARDVYTDLKGNLQDAGYQAIDAGRQAADAGKKAVHDLTDAGRKIAHDLADTGKKAACDLADSGKESLKSCASEGRKQLSYVEDYVREHPVRSVLLSAAAGILISKFLK